MKNHSERTVFVHLGDRLLAIGRIREGVLTVEEAAKELGVHAQDVIAWQQLHAIERMVTLDELRGAAPGIHPPLQEACMKTTSRRAPRGAGATQPSAHAQIR